MRRFHDPPSLPGSGLSPARCLARALPLAGTPGEDYVERRGIPVGLASDAGVRFEADFAGRSAVLVGLHDRRGALTAVHGRYLENLRGEDKMLTVGERGGVISVQGGLDAQPLVLVEGLFDALSLAVCGQPAIANIGREISWLAEAARGRDVRLAFDATAPGEDEAARTAAQLTGARVSRLLPPPRCKDWNTALVKRGAWAVSRWLRRNLSPSAIVRE